MEVYVHGEGLSLRDVFLGRMPVGDAFRRDGSELWGCAKRESRCVGFSVEVCVCGEDLVLEGEYTFAGSRLRCILLKGAGLSCGGVPSRGFCTVAFLWKCVLMGRCCSGGVCFLRVFCWGMHAEEAIANCGRAPSGSLSYRAVWYLCSGRTGAEPVHLAAVGVARTKAWYGQISPDPVENPPGLFSDSTGGSRGQEQKFCQGAGAFVGCRTPVGMVDC